MKGHVIAIIPVEVPDRYLNEDGTLPWGFEQDVATLLDVRIAQNPTAFNYGDSEVWTVTAFQENGGSLTEDHPSKLDGKF